MPFDSNGVFTRVMNWTSDQQNGIAIECGRHDQEDDNFAEGFNDTFCRDGRAAATGDFNLGSHKVKNLANGTAATDAATKGQLDSVNSTLSAQIANAVTLTGAQTITGAKTFSSGVTFASGTWNAVGDDAYFGDNNESGAFCIKGKNANTGLMLFNRAETINLGFYIDESDGNALKLTNPTYGAERWGSVTAMSSQSLSPNGYVKYNNGLIIQWGYSSVDNDQVTLPTPFSNTNYRVCATYMNTSSIGSSYGHVVTYPTSTTSFYANTEAGIYQWIAIGY